MSNANLFRRYERAEMLMMNRCMPKVAATTPAPKPERRPAPLTFTIADAAKVTR